MPDCYLKILFFIFVYLAGRISLVTHYTIGEEDKRFINYQAFPQNTTCEIITVFRKGKQASSVIRKKTFQFFSSVNLSGKKYFVPSTCKLIPLASYSGHYIDPPKIA